MVTKLAATVIDGALLLDEPLRLPDQSRVTVVIESASATAGSRGAFESFKKYSDEHPVDSEGHRFTRDELHERR